MEAKGSNQREKGRKSFEILDVSEEISRRFQNEFDNKRRRVRIAKELRRKRKFSIPSSLFGRELKNSAPSDRFQQMSKLWEIQRFKNVAFVPRQIRWISGADGPSNSYSVFGLSFNRFSPQTLVASCSDGLLRVYDNRLRRRVLTSNQGHYDAANATSFVDENMFISVSDDKCSLLWDLRKMDQEVKLLIGHAEWVKNVSVFHDRRRVVTSGCDGTIRYYDISKPEETLYSKPILYLSSLCRTKLDPVENEHLILTTWKTSVFKIANFVPETLEEQAHIYCVDRLMMESRNFLNVRRNMPSCLVPFSKYTNRVQLVHHTPFKVTSSGHALDIHPDGKSCMVRHCRWPWPYAYDEDFIPLAPPNSPTSLEWLSVYATSGAAYDDLNRIDSDEDADSDGSSDSDSFSDPSSRRATRHLFNSQARAERVRAFREGIQSGNSGNQGQSASERLIRPIRRQRNGQNENGPNEIPVVENSDNELDSEAEEDKNMEVWRRLRIDRVLDQELLKNANILRSRMSMVFKEWNESSPQVTLTPQEIRDTAFFRLCDDYASGIIKEPTYSPDGNMIVNPTTRGCEILGYSQFADSFSKALSEQANLPEPCSNIPDRSLKVLKSMELDKSCLCVQFSPDSHSIVAGDIDGNLTWFSVF